MALRKSKLLLILISALLATIVLLVAFLFTADLGFVKPRLEQALSASLQREIRIDGELRIELGLESVLSAQDLVLADAEWSGEGSMLRLGWLEVRLRPLSLLRRTIEIERLEARHAQLRLARDESGAGNWPLAELEPRSRPEDSEPGQAFHLVLKDVEVSDVSASLVSVERSQPLLLVIHSFSQIQRDDGDIEYSLAGTSGSREISLTGDVGPWQNVLAGTDVDFNLQARLDTLRLRASGNIDSLVQPSRPRIEVEAHGPDVKDLAALLGLGDTGEGDIRVAAKLWPQSGGPLVLDADGNLGATAFEARGEFSDLQRMQQIDVTAAASGPDLGRTLSLFGLHTTLNAPFEVDLDAFRRNRQVVIERGNVRLGDTSMTLVADIPDISNLQKGRFDFTFGGADFAQFRRLTGLPGASQGAFKVESRLQTSESGDHVVSLLANLPLGTVRATGEIGPGPNFAGSRAAFELHADDFAKLVALHSQLAVPPGPLTAQGSIEVRSDSVTIVGPIEARLPGLELRLSGHVSRVAGMRGSELQAGLNGPGLRTLLSGFGLQLPLPDAPFTLEASVEVEGSDSNPVYRISRFQGSLGDVGLGGTARLVPGPGFAGSSLSMESSGPAFEELVRGAGIEAKPGPFSFYGHVDVGADELRLQQLRLERTDGQAMLDLTLGLPVSRRVAEFVLSARGEDLHALFQGVAGIELANSAYNVMVHGGVDGEHWRFDRVELGVGDARAKARGDLNLGASNRRSYIELSGEIPNLAALGRWRDRRPLDQRLAWSASITAESGSLAADDIVVRLDQSNIRGSLNYLRGDVPRVDVRLESDSIIIKPLLEPVGADPVAIVEQGDGLLIPDVTLPLELLDAMNGSLEINIRELLRDDLHLRDIGVSATLRDGSLVIERAGLKGPAGHAEALARIDTAGETATVALLVLARDFALGLSTSNKDLANRSRLDINLTARGANLRSLAASANGALLADSRGGRSPGAPFLERIYGDAISQILNTINPFSSGRQDTALECAVIPLAFDAGKVTARPAAFISTDKVRMTVNPTINLANEKLDVNVQTAARKGLGISAGEVLNQFVKIVGTLASPRLAVDEQGALIRGGAAVATGGLTILAKMARDRLTRSRKPCDDTFSEASTQLSDRLPTLTHNTIAELEPARDGEPD